jgi:UDP-glucose 4-epimerase
MDLAGKRFLVVGGAGFIGSHVVDELLKRSVAEVVIYDSFVRGTMANLEKAKADPRLTIVSDRPQVSDLDRLVHATTGIDGVFNLAAIGILACNELPEKAMRVNVEGNWNVFLAATRCGVKKIVHSSSASVYGDAQRIPMDEEHPYNNRTLYGATKIATEHMLPVCSEMSGLKWKALRYFNVYGPRQDYKGAYISVLHRILDRLYASQPPILFGDGSQTLDFVHVSDVARANVLAMESEASSGFYNVCSGKGTTLGEVTNLLMDLTAIHLEPEYRKVNIGTSLVSKRIGDPNKALDGLGFSALVSLAEGMQSLIKWRQFNESQLHNLQTHDKVFSATSATAQH